MGWIALYTPKRILQSNCTIKKCHQVHALRQKEDPTSSTSNALQCQSNTFLHRHSRIVYLCAWQSKPHKHLQQTKHTGAQGTLASPLQQLSIHDCTAKLQQQQTTCPHRCRLFKMHLVTIVLPRPRSTLPLRTIQHVPHRHEIDAPTTETTNSPHAANACIPTASSMKHQNTFQKSTGRKAGPASRNHAQTAVDIDYFPPIWKLRNRMCKICYPR